MRNFCLYIPPASAGFSDEPYPSKSGVWWLRDEDKNCTLKSHPLHSLSTICFVPATVKKFFEKASQCSKNKTSVGGFGLHFCVKKKVEKSKLAHHGDCSNHVWM